MSSILSYISTKVKDGKEFDTLVGNLLSYKPEVMGYIEQDYNSIGADFSANSNSLYNLPVGNYKITNLPISPFNTDFVNISIYQQSNIKIAICDIGGNDKYFTEMSDSSESISWTNLRDADNVNATLIDIGDTSPQNTSMIWIDTSKIDTDNIVSLKYYDNSSKKWVSYSFINNMLQSIYDINKLKKDPYSEITEALEVIKTSATDKLVAHIDNSNNGWGEITIPNTSLYSVCSGDNSLVSIPTINGKTNQFLYSEDCVDWTYVTISSTSRMWKSVCYGNGKYVAVAWDNTFAYSLDGITWTETIASAAAKSWQSICYGNGRYVAIAYNSNTFAYSVNGISWVEVNIGSINQNWVSICYGKGKFVAIANDNTFAYSTDAIVWTTGSITPISRGWNSICYGNDKFIISGNDSFIAYSTNGITWDEMTISSSFYKIISLCYGDGNYVALIQGSTNYLHSNDGISWSEKKISLEPKEWTSVCYGNGGYVAVSSDGIIASNLSSSTDIHLSKSERKLLNSMISKDAVNVVFAKNGELATALINSATSKIDRSFDYSAATNTVNTASTNLTSHINDHLTIDKVNSWNNKANADHTHLADGKVTVNPSNITGSYTIDQLSGVVADRVYEISSFGILSSAENTRPLLDSIYHNGNTLYTEDSSGKTVWKKIVDNTKFGTANYEEGLIDFSITVDSSFENISNIPSSISGYNITDAVVPEDINETKEALHYTYTPEAYSVKNIAESEVYVGIQKTLSVDGGGTDEHPMSTQHAELDVILAAGDTANLVSSNVFKCNCEAEKCAYIEHWTEGYISDFKRPWKSICYGNGRYVMVSSDPFVAYSDDGIVWTEVNLAKLPNINFPYDYKDICYGNGKYVMISPIYIAYSDDGATWTDTGIGDDFHCNSICYGNNMFIIISDNPSIFAHSTDCVNWIVTDMTAYGNSWKSICYGNGKFVAVSNTNPGKTVYSTDGINWNRGEDLFDEGFPTQVCYGNGKFVVIAKPVNENSDVTSYIAYSTDGINWTSGVIADEYIEWSSICYLNDKFMAVSYDGKFIYSIDGIKWEIDTNNLSLEHLCYGSGKCIAIKSGMSDSYAQIIDYLGMPSCKAVGLSLIPSDIPAIKYFENIYDEDTKNPKWNTEGLGRMIKIDKSTQNTVINEKFKINNHEYDIKVQWDPNVGVIFDMGVVEATETCQSMHDNMCTHLEGVQAAIALHEKLFTENGWK